jgi:hypothetical protein
MSGNSGGGISRIAVLALASLAAAALSACYYTSLPADSAAGTNCQKTTYGVALLASSSNTACDQSAPPAAGDTPSKPAQQ